MEAQAELDGFIDRYDAVVAAHGRRALAWLTDRMPGAWRLVYDNYNALAIAFAANEKLTSAAMSVALYPRWVSLFFSRGVLFDDPAGLLEGTGRGFRHVKLREIALLDDPSLARLVDQAVATAEPPIDPTTPGRLIIKSVSAKQRPRRP